MLALVGIGLDCKDISVKSLEFLKSADLILLEGYTSMASRESLDFISRETGKELVSTKRSDFEDNLKATVALARDRSVAVLVVGDPLVATTHHIILDEAAKQGISTAVFHAPSVFSAAIGESGLDIYRFGPTTTIPYWSERYKPVSFIDSIERNLGNAQHTLVLLDINQSEGRPMSIAEAHDTAMAAMEKSGKTGIMDRKVLVIADIGRKGQEIDYIAFAEARSLSGRLAGKAISIIVPAELNFAEAESLGRFKQ